MDTLVCVDCAAANINAEENDSATYYPIGTTFQELPDVMMFKCDSCDCSCFGQPMKVEFYELAAS